MQKGSATHVLFLIAILLFSATGRGSSTANTTANATATILTSIGISKVQDLAFGEAAPGDVSKAVNPATDTTNSASFTVTGEASHAFNISLPSDGSVTMITDDGATADEQIAV